MKPDIVIADEPTTALDVTVQAEVLALLEELQAEMGMGLLLITHDLGVVAEVADRVVVMNAGEIVEAGTPTEIYHHAKHPYTRKLIAAAPGRGEMSRPIKGGEPMLRVEDACKTYGTLPGAEGRLLHADEGRDARRRRRVAARASRPSPRRSCG